MPLRNRRNILIVLAFLFKILLNKGEYFYLDFVASKMF